MLQAVQGGGGTVAATGTVQTDAALLTKGVNEVTGADGTKGVILPPANAGDVIIVTNVVAAALKIYPDTGGLIGTGAANAAFVTTASKSLMLACWVGSSGGASKWRVIQSA
jgi:hypothetical protein